jgi:5-methylcytosine-specific restriction protein A
MIGTVSTAAGFIEVHHLLPLHTLKPGSRTRMHDLAVVCANCHRMIHAKSKWLTLVQLKELLAERNDTADRDTTPELGIGLTRADTPPSFR